MVDMQLTNNKLVDRGVKMLMKNTGIINYEEATQLLLANGSVRKATEAFKNS
jgi:N-acetylmuramic acid 6-phosphate etherase